MPPVLCVHPFSVPVPLIAETTFVVPPPPGAIQKKSPAKFAGSARFVKSEIVVPEALFSNEPTFTTRGTHAGTCKPSLRRWPRP